MVTFEFDLTYRTTITSKLEYNAAMFEISMSKMAEAQNPPPACQMFFEMYTGAGVYWLKPDVEKYYGNDENRNLKVR